MKKFIHQIESSLSRPASKIGMIKEVEGLRFLAILLVLFQHLNERMLRYHPSSAGNGVIEEQASFLVSRGTIGVFLFFAVSGFIITMQLAGKNSPTPISGYGKYLKRRFMRIEMPYFIWMSVFAVVLLIKSPGEYLDLFWHYLASMSYLHNIIYDSYSTINPVAWSLEIEVQFYLLAPFIVWGINKIADNGKRLIVLGFAIITIILLQFNFGWWHFPLKATLLGQFQHFLTGIFMAYWWIENQTKLKKSWWFDSLFVAALFLMAYTWTTELTKNLIFTSALIALFISAFRGKATSTFLSTRWVTIVGGMCYSIYLVHLPLMELLVRFTDFVIFDSQYLLNLLLHLIILLPVVFIVAAIAFSTIEKPFMSFHKQGFASFQLFRGNHGNYKRFSGKIAVILLMISISVTVASAQDNTDDLKLRPLPDLIEAAISNAAELRRSEMAIQKVEAQIKLERKSWMNHISANGSVNYGTGSIIDNNYDGVITSVNQLNRSNLLYSLGVGIRLPLGEVMNRQSREKIILLEKQGLQEEKSMVKNTLEELVIERYFDLKDAYQLTRNNAEIMESSRIALEVTEKFFKSGKAQVDDYKTVLEGFYQNKSDFEKSKLIFQQKHELLKSLVGEEVLVL